MRVILALFSVLFLFGCYSPGGQELMLLSDAQKQSYYEQLVIRWDVQHPFVSLPEQEKLYDAIEGFYEFPADEHPTCYYRPSKRSIHIGEGRWQSGCVPHEMGHAACYIFFDAAPFCKEFEH